jgi:putative membrane protein
MRRLINFYFFTIFLGLSLFGCSTNSGNMNNSTTTAPNTSTRTNSANGNMTMTNTRSDTKTGDTEFMTEAAQGGMAEVELGKLAATKAQNAEVKRFGQKMVEDHSKANAELKELAVKKNLSLPTEVNSKQKDLMDKLSKLSGAEFDKAYVDAMVDDHEEDVEAFKDESEGGKDAEVKAWAGKTLPTLQSHLDMIKAIQAKMK